MSTKPTVAVRSTTHEIREVLSGNLCRCTGYTSIVDGVKVALGNGAGSTPLPHERPERLEP